MSLRVQDLYLTLERHETPFSLIIHSHFLLGGPGGPLRTFEEDLLEEDLLEEITGTSLRYHLVPQRLTYFLVVDRVLLFSSLIVTKYY